MLASTPACVDRALEGNGVLAGEATQRLVLRSGGRTTGFGGFGG